MGAAGSAAGADGAGVDAAAAAKAAADAAAAQVTADAKAKADAAAAAANKGRPKVPRQPAPPPKPPAEPTFSVNGKNFMKRVSQVAAKEAEKRVMDALGCTLEEAKTRLAAAAAGNTAAAGPAATAANDAEVKKLKAEKERLDRENTNLKGQIKNARSKDAARIQELEDELEKKRVTDIAKAKGFVDPGYAMFKLAEAAAASDEKIDEAKFFDELATAVPQMIATAAAAPAAPAAPRRVGASTAPAASPAPGGQLPSTSEPNPAPSGQASGEKHVNDMTPAEFRNHTETTFGYRQGR